MARRTLRCTGCRDQSIRPSRERLDDLLFRLVGMRAYRCLVCDRRFHAWPVRRTSAAGAWPKERAESKEDQCTKQEILLQTRPFALSRGANYPVQIKLRTTIESEFQRVANENNKRLAPLTDDLELLICGLDSLGFATVVTRLEETLGLDPFASTPEDVFFPQTFGEFVRFYENAPH